LLRVEVFGAIVVKIDVQIPLECAMRTKKNVVATRGFGKSILCIRVKNVLLRDGK
jgi:hypothetical protein